VVVVDVVVGAVDIALVDVMVVSVDIVLVVLVVPDVSVVLIVPVVPVTDVSVVLIVLLVELVALMEVSVVAVSVLTFSSFLQPKAKTATATRARRVTRRDFFISIFLLKGLQISRSDADDELVVGLRWRSSGCPNHLPLRISKTLRAFRFRSAGWANRPVAASWGYILGTTVAMSSDAVTQFPLSRVQSPPPVSGLVRSFDATPIHYDLYDAPSRGLVLVVPGFWRDRGHPAMVRLAHLLTGQGYRTAIIDLRGHGDSGGKYGFNLYEHYDVSAVADDLLKKLPIESITLVGLSYGGAIAVSTAARHKLPIASLLLISPVAGLSMIAPRINPFTIHRHIAFSQALRRPRFNWRRTPRLRAVDDIRDVHAPLCLIHVKNDWLVDHSHSVAIYDAANEPKELHVIDIEGNYHADRIFSVAANEIEPMCLSFLERYTPR